MPDTDSFLRKRLGKIKSWDLREEEWPRAQAFRGGLPAEVCWLLVGGGPAGAWWEESGEYSGSSSCSVESRGSCQFQSESSTDREFCHPGVTALVPGHSHLLEDCTSQ